MKTFGWKTWLGLLGLTSIGLVATLPATMLDLVLSQASNGQMALASAEGTIWNGGGQVLLAGDALNEKLSWKWRPADVLTGKLGFELAGSQGGRGLVRLAPGSIDLADFDLTFRAAPLFKLDKRALAYRLGGDFKVQATQLHYKGGKIAGTPQIDWLDARAEGVTGDATLGSYRLTLQPDTQGGAQLNVSTLAGPLQLGGSGQWTPQGGLAATVTLQAMNGAESSIGALLSQIGPADAGGVRQVSFNLK
ncbi:type II secretion system protein N [Parachitinimonas caeni]|uniref:Type II secretion system protein N n=1 Tax=Parachitinimonas caeni TaxID=3031301 RepID=A0ABT7DUA4_9NEIS|nr:type II secretion system protein N [Parachitinimonas caeni]MDK2123399.1 type II secretion system protein N [Parachitinimonas caeni]